ncbi:MAG TPA: hypothetical protein VGF30_06660 [Bacteroidia bacterium]
MKKAAPYTIISWIITLCNVTLLVWFGKTAYTENAVLSEGAIIPVSIILFIAGGSTGLSFSCFSAYQEILSGNKPILKTLKLMFLVFPCILISCGLLYAAFLFLACM